MGSLKKTGVGFDAGSFPIWHHAVKVSCKWGLSSKQGWVSIRGLFPYGTTHWRFHVNGVIKHGWLFVRGLFQDGTTHWRFHVNGVFKQGWLMVRGHFQDGTTHWRFHVHGVLKQGWGGFFDEGFFKGFFHYRNKKGSWNRVLKQSWEGFGVGFFQFHMEIQTGN